MKQTATYAKNAKNSKQDSEDARIVRIVAQVLAAQNALYVREEPATTETRVSAKSNKRAKKAVNPYFAYRHSEQAKLDSEKNRSMSAAIRAQSASAKEVAKFVASKRAYKQATGERWAEYAKQYGYRV